MHSGHLVKSLVPKKISNKSVILNLMMMRKQNNSIFSAIPKDITNYIIDLLSQLPTHNLFDVLTSGLMAVCEDYKTDYIFFKNPNNELASEVQEFTKLLVMEKEIDEKQAFVFLTIYLFELIDVLNNFIKERLFLNKIYAFLKQNDCHVIYDLACDKVMYKLFNGGGSRDAVISSTKAYSIQFQKMLSNAQHSGTHVSLPDVLKGLLCYLSMRGTFTDGRLNNYLLKSHNFSIPFCADERIKILNHLKERYETIIKGCVFFDQDNPGYYYISRDFASFYEERSLKNTNAHNKIYEALQFHLNQPLPEDQLLLSRCKK